MPSKPKTSRAKEKDYSLLKRVSVSSIISSVVFFVLIAVFSFAVLKTDMFSSSSYMFFGVISAALSAFLCGFITVRPIRKNGIVYGAVSGFVLALICSAVMFFVNGNKSGVGIFILMVLFVVFSALGGISAVNFKVKKKYI